MIHGRDIQKHMASGDERIHRRLLFVAGAELDNVFWPGVTGDSAGARVMGCCLKNN